jgi:GTP:adenosylcobinamide-phosphate guanylyltransferase
MERNNVEIPLLIMAGGSGTRMNFSDKGLLMVKGETLITRNINMFRHDFKPIYIAISTRTVMTEKYFRDKEKLIETTGEDYTKDISLALKEISMYPLLVLPSDVFIRSADVILNFLDFAKKKGKGISSLLIEGLFCGISIFYGDPTKISADEFYVYNVAEKDVYNINTVEDFFLIINKLKNGKM